MLTHITIWLCIVKVLVAQLNGEFWWLNERLADYNHARPPPPKFEDLSEFDNDESAKIVFRDDNLITNSVAVTINSINVTETSTDIEKSYLNESIKFPVDNVTVQNEHLKVETNKPEMIDRLVFKFPEEHRFVWKDMANVNKVSNLPFTANDIEDSSDYHNDKVSSDKNNIHSENVCNFMDKSECYRKHGLVHQHKYAKKIYINQQLICCIFPLPSRHAYASPKIYFPNDPSETLKRRKRANDEYQNLKQRNILLQRRLKHSSRQGTTPRIATPDYEDDDPYWNIKTIKSSNKQSQVTKKYDYRDDYEEDYASEIPRPGLTGLYSDNMEPSWPPQNEKKYGEYSDEYVDDSDDTGTFGYSTVDPRVTKSKSKPKGKPIKLTTTSEEISYNAESQTISYQAKPNFNVFQDFKLLLNKRRPKLQRRSTAVDSIIDDSEEPLEIESTNFDDENRQVYQDCGKSVFLSKLNKQDNQIGETVNGSHPWLALVVPTRKRHLILCYATLIHPRAAITLAHCVYKKSPGEITLVTGIWDLTEILHAENRAVSVRTHCKYTHGELSHDLAMLHWMRPLEMSVNVQPACLADPHYGADCMFFGWGGFDQAMKRRPRWQRASVHSCNGSLSLINGEGLPSDAFCATVVSRSTVTGMGGSLLCNTDGRLSVVGVAISRDSTLALLPAHQWAIDAVAALNE